MAGTLLVAGQYVTYRTVEQGIVGGEDGPAWHTEDRLHTFVLETLHQ
jgi:hypothetical protein